MARYAPVDARHARRLRSSAANHLGSVCSDHSEVRARWIILSLMCAARWPMMESFSMTQATSMHRESAWQVQLAQLDKLEHLYLRRIQARVLKEVLQSCERIKVCENAPCLQCE